MKRIILVLIVLMLLVACGPSDEDCDLAWNQLDVDPGDEAFYVNIVLNTNHAPDTVGFMIEECIEGRWDGWR